MIEVIIFDLSDVLLTGLTGIERTLGQVLHVPEDQVLSQFRGLSMLEYLVGKCSEDDYLKGLKQEYSWPVEIDEIKKLIRLHFKNTIPGMKEIIENLAEKYPLYLLSDHGREWIEFIEEEHPFLQLFKHRFYSFDLKTRKRDPETYQKVLSEINVCAEVCLFIDDRPMFFQVAQKIGMNVIHFKYSVQLIEELKNYSIIL
jgi:HAD superfamily hydrolase (TIGR01509 family)